MPSVKLLQQLPQKLRLPRPPQPLPRIPRGVESMGARVCLRSRMWKLPKQLLQEPLSEPSYPMVVV